MNRRAPAGLALGALLAALLIMLGEAATAATATVSFTVAPEDSTEKEARAATPPEDTSVTGSWVIKATVKADAPDNPGEVPSFLKRVTVSVVPVEGERGEAYNDGEPLLDEAYPCPDDGEDPDTVRSEAEVAVPWDTTTSRNGVYRLVIEGYSCRAEDGVGQGSHEPVLVDNTPATPSAPTARPQDGLVTLSWRATGTDDSAGFQVFRTNANGTDFALVGTSEKPSFQEELTPGTYRYRVVALRESSSGSAPLASDPSDPSDELTIEPPTSTVPGTATRPTTEPAPGSGTPTGTTRAGAPPPLYLPPVDNSPASTAPVDTLLPPPTPPGTYEENLPYDPTRDVPVIEQDTPEPNAGESEQGGPSYEAAARRRLAAGEVLEGNVGVLGIGIVLIVCALHVSGFLVRTRLTPR